MKQGPGYQSKAEQGAMPEVTEDTSKQRGVFLFFSCTSFYYGLTICFVDFEIQRSPKR